MYGTDSRTVPRTGSVRDTSEPPDTSRTNADMMSRLSRFSLGSILNSMSLDIDVKDVLPRVEIKNPRYLLESGSSLSSNGENILCMYEVISPVKVPRLTASKNIEVSLPFIVCL